MAVSSAMRTDWNEREADANQGSAPAAGHVWRWQRSVAARRDRGAPRLAVPLPAARQGERDGSGGFPAGSLDAARDKAQAARKQLASDIDPIDQRAAERQAAETQAAHAITFAETAKAYIEANESGWRSDKSAMQWRNSLAAYAVPVLGKMACSAIATDDVLKVLKPIWAAKPETATRVRRRIEAVLSYAKAHGWRSGAGTVTGTFGRHLRTAGHRRGAARRRRRSGVTENGSRSVSAETIRCPHRAGSRKITSGAMRPHG